MKTRRKLHVKMISIHRPSVSTEKKITDVAAVTLFVANTSKAKTLASPTEKKPHKKNGN